MANETSAADIDVANRVMLATALTITVGIMQVRDVLLPLKF